MNDHEIALKIIVMLEEAKSLMEELRKDSDNKWDKRGLSIAITELETSQLWLANSKPD